MNHQYKFCAYALRYNCFELYLGDITDNYLNVISFYLHYLDSKLVDLS